MNQLELQGFQAQNASLPYWILLRNEPVGALQIPGSHCESVVLTYFAGLFLNLTMKMYGLQSTTLIILRKHKENEWF